MKLSNGEAIVVIIIFASLLAVFAVSVWAQTPPPATLSLDNLVVSGIALVPEGNAPPAIDLSPCQNGALYVQSRPNRRLWVCANLKWTGISLGK